MNWLKINNQSLWGKLIRLPLKLLPKNLVLPIVSGPSKGLKWRVGSSVHGCWLGTYELKKQQSIKKWLKPGMTAYDIGANAGIYSLLFSKAVRPEGRVYAFEPLGENATNILYHVRLNNLKNVVLVQAALSTEVGMASFAIANSNSMGCLAKNTPFRVPTLTLDVLINNFDFPVPGVIKMDVEGAESAVLMGSADLLSKHSTVWFIALHGNEQRTLCQDILQRRGYQIFTLEGVEVTGPINETTDEIFALPIA